MPSLKFRFGKDTEFVDVKKATIGLDDYTIFESDQFVAGNSYKVNSAIELISRSEKTIHINQKSSLEILSKKLVQVNHKVEKKLVIDETFEKPQLKIASLMGEITLRFSFQE